MFAAAARYTEAVADRLAAIGDLQLACGSAAMMLCSFAAFVVGRRLLGRERTSGEERRRAWTITFVAAVVTSQAGAYFALKLIGALPAGSDASSRSSAPAFAGGKGLVDGLPFTERDAQLAHALCIFYLSYCAVDSLVSACLAHPGHSTYEHHAAYAVLLGCLLLSRNEVFFALGAIEEIPTLLKACFELRGDARPRLTVGVAIFAFRITWHVYAAYVSIAHANAALYFTSAVLLLEHIRWFRDWVFERVSRVREQDDEAARKSGREAANGAGGAANGAGASTAPLTVSGAASKRLSLEVESHIWLVGTLFALQAVLHIAVVVSEVRDTLLPRANWSERNWALAALVLMLGMHALTFLLTWFRMGSILLDIYSEHFVHHKITQRAVIYNISWEDPRVERELLDIGPSDVILTISSAGCNVLDYLIQSPEAIVACDLNAAQLAVLELKLACISRLEHKDFFAIWAESSLATFEAHYRSTLRPALSAASAAFWDESETLFADNFMFAGTSGLAARILQPLVRFLGLRAYMLKRRAYPPASVLLAVIRQMLSTHWLWVLFAPLGGVPRAQLELIKRTPHVWVDRLEEVVGRRMWLAGNYFYYAYVVGRWSLDCCPRYLEPRHFATLKANASRVTLFHGPVAEAAKLRSDFTVASLLDSMDWMPDAAIAQQLAALLPQMSPRGHVFWRSFGTAVHSPVLAQLGPTLVPDEDGAERVGWYLSQWVAPTPAPTSSARAPAAAPDFSQYVREGGGRPCKPNTILDDVAVMVAMGAHAARRNKDVRAFYRSQGANYDGFREALLPGRDLLLKYCLPWARKPRTWLSVGCGTARDIEYVVQHVRACGTRLYLLDLSPELLEMATARVNALGLQGQVTLLEADVTTAFGDDGKAAPHLARAGLPPLGSFDVVTCSYCLTMIPPWRRAIEVMVDAVAVGGVFAMIDFTRRSDCPEHWLQRLIGWWFSNDGVFLDVEHTRTLRAHPRLDTFWFAESEARVPYTPFNATHYTWAARKRA